MKRFALATIVLLGTIYAAAAQFNGCPPGLCGGAAGMGSSGGGFGPGGGTPIPDCANPTNGQIDFSVCSNAVYVSLVL